MERYLGEAVPKLGFGMMRLPQTEQKIDVEQTKEMVDRFLAAGFRYFDTAWGYPGSEEAVGQALVARYPRESYLLATKCPAWVTRSREKVLHMLQTSLERTGAGYFDYYLLHNLGEHRTRYFDEYGIWDWVQEQKQAGLIRHVGFSFHDRAQQLDQILTAHPEMEFVQLQINYADWENPAVESRKCYETARRHGKPIIIMEPVKGGRLAKLPQPVESIFREAAPDASLASWAVRYAASLEGIITVLSGMSTVAQVEDNVSYMKEFRPLHEGERLVVEQARQLLESYSSIPCTNCHYCTTDCPTKIAIPGIFEALNVYQMYQDLAAAQSSYRWNTRGHRLAGATACVSCGHCEQVCPQHIAIREHLARAAALLERGADAGG